MRKYSPKDSAQKRVSYSDNFKSVPEVAKFNVQEDSFFADVVNKLKEKFDIKQCYIELNTLVIQADATKNVEILSFLKDECCFKVCSELSAVDYLAQSGEFEIFYQLLNLDKAKRARLEVRVAKDQAINSVVSLYKMANFAEREMFDMFGIYVNNHPYLKRILMPDDWEGHPLLKTYPLQGDEAASWYEVDKIFGKEYRDVVGPEIRDSARVDRGDSKRFARVGKEVPYGADPELIESQENAIEDGYSKTFATNYKKGSKELENRK
jgi:NADH-quinone oxidoreductase subunit C